MSKLIDVDKIYWQKGVFVNPNTEKPLPVIHKIATIEMLRDWQEEVKAIPLDRLKQFRNEVMNMNSVAIIQRLDKLIAESEEHK